MPPFVRRGLFQSWLIAIVNLDFVSFFFITIAVHYALYIALLLCLHSMGKFMLEIIFQPLRSIYLANHTTTTFLLLLLFLLQETEVVSRLGRFQSRLDSEKRPFDWHQAFPIRQCFVPLEQPSKSSRLHTVVPA